MPDKEVFKRDAVLEEVAETRVEATFVQRAGLWLAGGVGGVIAVVTVGAVFFLYAHYPPMPSAEVFKLPPADAKAVLEQYRELSGVAIKSTQDLFQTLVTQALLPVFTLILGYIFGRGSGKDDSR